MLKNLKIGLRSKLAIVSVLETKEITSYACLTLKKVGKQLSIVNFHQELSSIDEVKAFTKELPVVLVFLGNKVLHTTENSLYLNNSSEEYFSTSYSGVNDQKFTALARKNYVNEIREDFEEKNFLIVDVFQGALEMNTLYKTLFVEKQVQVFDIELSYDDKDCLSVKKVSPKLDSKTKVGSEEKSCLEVFLFAIGLNFFNENEKIGRTEQDLDLSQNKQEIHYKSQFEFITVVASIIFAFITIINFAVNGLYSYKGDHLNSQVYLVKNKQMELTRLISDKERKTKFISISGFLNSNYISFYINEISSILPRSIVLSEIHSLPNENKIINTNQKIEINDRLIKVAGISKQDEAFNQWVDSLHTKGWVEKIGITKYEQKSRNNTNFEIEIELK